MQKILGFGFLFLLWSNITFAKVIELDQGVKIKIPEGYEYVQFDRLKHMRSKRGEFKDLTESQFREFINKQQSVFGMNGDEISTIILRKEFKDSYIDLINFTSTGKKWMGWPGMKELANPCATKKTGKAVQKCIVEKLKMDPIIVIDVANGIVKDPVLISALKKIDEYKISGDERIIGIRLKNTTYIYLHNEHVLGVRGICFSKKNCKKIKNLKNEIIGPYLSMKTIK